MKQLYKLFEWNKSECETWIRYFYATENQIKYLNELIKLSPFINSSKIITCDLSLEQVKELSNSSSAYTHTYTQTHKFIGTMFREFIKTDNNYEIDPLYKFGIESICKIN